MKPTPSIQALMDRIEKLEGTLNWISMIALANHDDTAKVQAGANRTLKRIADRADEVLEEKA